MSSKITILSLAVVFLLSAIEKVSAQGLPPPPPPPPPGGCSCSDYVTSSGYGNCKKKFKIGPICYVNEPSTCTDLVESQSTGKRYSWDACAPPPPPQTSSISNPPHPPPP